MDALASRVAAAEDRASHFRQRELFTFGRLYKFPWRVSDAVEGVQIFGGTGSGKTTGSGRTLAVALLRAGFGGLVLTVKPDEADSWGDYFREAQRPLSDLVRVHFDSHHCFNGLRYEFHRAGLGSQLTQNLVSLFMTSLGNDVAGQSSDPYWDLALRQLLTNAIDTMALAGQPVTLSGLMETILSAPRRPTASDAEYQGSVCARHLRDAAQRALSEDEQWDLKQCIGYWGSDFSNLAERTRSSIISTFTSRATTLLRGRLRRMFCSDGEDTFPPTLSHQGKVILLDLPVKEFGDTGRFAQVLYKTIWQRATERRTDMRAAIVNRNGERVPNTAYNPDFSPVFLWADEAQHFTTREDLYFQATARSSLAATVYLTQNISSYHATMGGSNASAVTDSFLGNLVTKIFHANGDPATNEWASSAFGSHDSWSQTLHAGQGAGLPLAGGNASYSERTTPLVGSHVFPALKIRQAVIFHPRSLASHAARTGRSDGSSVDTWLHQFEAPPSAKLS